eukprot:gene3194-3942_t
MMKAKQFVKNQPLVYLSKSQQGFIQRNFFGNSITSGNTSSGTSNSSLPATNATTSPIDLNANTSKEGEQDAASNARNQLTDVPTPPIPSSSVILVRATLAKLISRTLRVLKDDPSLHKDTNSSLWQLQYSFVPYAAELDATTNRVNKCPTKCLHSLEDLSDDNKFGKGGIGPKKNGHAKLAQDVAAGNGGKRGKGKAAEWRSYAIPMRLVDLCMALFAQEALENSQQQQKRENNGSESGHTAHSTTSDDHSKSKPFYFLSKCLALGVQAKFVPLPCQQIALSSTEGSPRANVSADPVSGPPRVTRLLRSPQPSRATPKRKTKPGSNSTTQRTPSHSSSSQPLNFQLCEKGDTFGETPNCDLKVHLLCSRYLPPSVVNGTEDNAP